MVPWTFCICKGTAAGSEGVGLTVFGNKYSGPEKVVIEYSCLLAYISWKETTFLYN